MSRRYRRSRPEMMVDPCSQLLDGYHEEVYLEKDYASLGMSVEDDRTEHKA